MVCLCLYLFTIKTFVTVLVDKPCDHLLQRHFICDSCLTHNHDMLWFHNTIFSLHLIFLIHFIPCDCHEFLIIWQHRPARTIHTTIASSTICATYARVHSHLVASFDCASTTNRTDMKSNKCIETTERGLVVITVNEADGGRYDCYLGGSLLCSYSITVYTPPLLSPLMHEAYGQLPIAATEKRTAHEMDKLHLLEKNCFRWFIDKRHRFFDIYWEEMYSYMCMSFFFFLHLSAFSSLHVPFYRF